jgi:hypothetical protein
MGASPVYPATVPAGAVSGAFSGGNALGGEVVPVCPRHQCCMAYSALRCEI